MADTTSSIQAVNGPTTNRAAMLKSLGFSLLINAALPLLIYWALTSYAHVSDLYALIASGVPSILDSIIGVIRNKRIDFLAGIVLAGIAISLLIILLGGNAKVLLIRESFFTAAFGLAFLVSLAFPRPIMFYFGRHFATGNNPKNIEWFDSLWQYEGFRTTMRVMTIVWGIGLVLEAAIRTYLVFTLSIAQFLVVSPFVIYGIVGILVLWTFRYSRQGRQRSEALRQRMLAEQEAQPENGAAG